MSPFSFHPEAEDEFFTAIDYYEQCALGLGYDFSLEVYSAIQNILQHPKAWAILEKNIRRYLVNRFPFGILYAIENNQIFILAIMHLHKNPNYWKKRL